MNLRRLECFLAVARTLHFGRAAILLHMAQPPLSQQIRTLETELGVTLFERSNRSVRLTPAGEALLPEAEAVLARAELAAAQARRAHLGLAGRLCVGFVNPAMDGLLAPLLPAFQGERPGVELVLREMPSLEQLAALRAGDIHIGFVRHGWLDTHGLECAVVLREPYVLALPVGHRLASARAVDTRALDGETLLLPPRGSQPRLHAALMEAFASAGVRVRRGQEALSKHTTLSLVAAGMGLALMPRSTTVWSRDGVAYRKLTGFGCEVELAVARPPGRNPAAERLAEMARESGFRSPGP